MISTLKLSAIGKNKSKLLTAFHSILSDTADQIVTNFVLEAKIVLGVASLEHPWGVNSSLELFHKGCLALNLVLQVSWCHGMQLIPQPHTANRLIVNRFAV